MNTVHRSSCKCSIADWQLFDKLGSGSYAVVNYAVNRVTGVEAAVKTVDIEGLIKDYCEHGAHGVKNKKDAEYVAYNRVLNEVNILRQLSHVNIIKFYDVISDKHERKVYIVMELAKGGDLFDYIVKKVCLSESDARFLFRQLVSAVEYLHGNFIIHRDIKLENIMLSDEQQTTLKIIDFGLSKVIEPGRWCDDMCGSLQYTAPELLQESIYKGPPSDIWSMGVMLYVLVHGALPFFDYRKSTKEELLEAAMCSKYRLKSKLSESCKQLIQSMLHPDAEQRITIDGIRQHPWTNVGYHFPPKCLLPEYEVVESIDPEIVTALYYFGFKLDDIQCKLKLNERCQLVAMYHLLAEKKKKGNMCSCTRRRISFCSPDDEKNYPRKLLQQVEASEIHRVRNSSNRRLRPSSMDHRSAVKVDPQGNLCYDVSSKTASSSSNQPKSTTKSCKLAMIASSAMNKGRRFSLTSIIRKLSPKTSPGISPSTSPRRKRTNSSPPTVVAEQIVHCTEEK